MISRDPSLAGALEADEKLEAELGEDPEEDEPVQGKKLKTGFPELEKDDPPSALLLPASRCISRHAKKLDGLLQRFTKLPEGKKLSDLQDSLLGSIGYRMQFCCGVFSVSVRLAEAQGQTVELAEEA